MVISNEVVSILSLLHWHLSHLSKRKLHIELFLWFVAIFSPPLILKTYILSGSMIVVIDIVAGALTSLCVIYDTYVYSSIIIH